MKPIDFPEKTVDLQMPPGTEDKSVVAYKKGAKKGALPVFRHTEHGVTFSCWKMSVWERFCFLWHGRVWVWIWMGGVTQPPISMDPIWSPFKTPWTALGRRLSRWGRWLACRAD